MIDLTLLWAAMVAGFAYAIAPGPAVLALFGIAAGQGRGAGALFLSGHLVGDALWCGLALVAIIGAKVMGTLVFDLLGLACGGYLAWLGWSALRAKPRADGQPAMAVRRPWLRGMLFGVTNPKGYPVAVATFTALLGGQVEALGWSGLPWLVLAACAGSAASAALLVAIIGTEKVRQFYRRYEIWVVRASGVMFLGFALHALLTAIDHLWPTPASGRS